MKHIKIFALIVIILSACTISKTEQIKTAKDRQFKIAKFKEYIPHVEDLK